jgi:hypothetical protein
MDQAPGLQVLCYLTGRIASPVGAYVTTVKYFQTRSKPRESSKATSSGKSLTIDNLEDWDISGGIWTSIMEAQKGKTRLTVDYKMTQINGWSPYRAENLHGT